MGLPRDRHHEHRTCVSPLQMDGSSSAVELQDSLSLERLTPLAQISCIYYFLPLKLCVNK